MSVTLQDNIAGKLKASIQTQIRLTLELILFITILTHHHIFQNQNFVCESFSKIYILLMSR